MSSVCQDLSLIKSLAEFSSLGGGVACACRDDRFFLLEPRTCQTPVIATPALRCPPCCKPRLELHAGRNLIIITIIQCLNFFAAALLVLN
jgi:hypothetical protein